MSRNLYIVPSTYEISAEQSQAADLCGDYLSRLDYYKVALREAGGLETIEVELAEELLEFFIKGIEADSEPATAYAITACFATTVQHESRELAATLACHYAQRGVLSIALAARSLHKLAQDGCPKGCRCRRAKTRLSL